MRGRLPYWPEWEKAIKKNTWSEKLTVNVYNFIINVYLVMCVNVLFIILYRKALINIPID